STHFAAAKVVRAEQRRHTREQEAQTMRELLDATSPEVDWDKLRPPLDGATHQLRETDREAILARYFEGRPLADVGAGFIPLQRQVCRWRQIVSSTFPVRDLRRTEVRTPIRLRLRRTGKFP